jgi:hypothetical protein
VKPKPPRHSGLTPEVSALLAHERVPPPVDADVRQRVLTRAHEASLQPSPPHAASHPPRAPLSRPLVATIAGVAAFAGVVAWLALRERPSDDRPPPPAITPPVTAGPAPTPSPSLANEPEPSPSSLPILTPETLGPGVRPAVSSRSGDALDELSLLGRARRADSRGDYAEVLSLVAEHTQKYLHGRLSEEREVLRVKALVGLGRTEQARSAAARFRRQFPRSVLLERVDAMVPAP